MLRETYISNYLIDLEMNKKCLRMAIWKNINKENSTVAVLSMLSPNDQGN